MDATWRDGSRHERGTTTLEYVGVAVAAIVLLAGVAAGMRPGGASIGVQVGERIGALVSGDRSSWRWRDAREVRGEVGSRRVRVSRDELRMEPMLPPIAWWSREWSRHANVGGTTVDVEATACALCASLEHSHRLGPLASTGSEDTHAGLAAGLDLGAKLALVSAQVNARAERRWGTAVRMHGSGRARTTIGGEADGYAQLTASRDRVVLDAEVGAMAGAVARAEAQLGLHVLGVAIQQSGRVEGWAGAGAKGAAGIEFRDGAIAWRFGGGGALGIGGAGEWSGEVDVSGIPVKHRRLARDALVTSLRVAGLALPPLPPLTRP